MTWAKSAFVLGHPSPCFSVWAVLPSAGESLFDGGESAVERPLTLVWCEIGLNDGELLSKTLKSSVEGGELSMPPNRSSRELVSFVGGGGLQVDITLDMSYVNEDVSVVAEVGVLSNMEA